MDGPFLEDCTMLCDRIIDIDSLVYRSGEYGKKSRTGAMGAIRHMEKTLKRLREVTPATGEILLIKSMDKAANFRYGIYPEYKGNRPKMESPFYDQVRDYLLTQENAIDVGDQWPDLETDDAVGMVHKPSEDVIIHIDKDLDQYPGLHYNPSTDEHNIILPMDAARSFWIQVLMGDTVDNIIGIPGVGIKTATQILTGARTYAELEARAFDRYLVYTKDEDRALKVMTREAQLCWMARWWAPRWEPDLCDKWDEHYG